MSRAACSASVASLACSEPTCLWARPLRLRINTSHSGVFGVVIMTSLEFLRGLCRLPLLALFGMGQRRLAHPGAFVVRLAPRREPVAVARAVAGQHPLEFVPVDFAVFPMSGRLVLLHAGVGNRKPEIFRLRYRGIDEFLPQFVIGEALDLPFGRGVAVLARLVRRP